MRPSNPPRNVASFKNAESVATAPQLRAAAGDGALTPSARDQCFNGQHLEHLPCHIRQVFSATVANNGDQLAPPAPPRSRTPPDAPATRSPASCAVAPAA